MTPPMKASMTDSVNSPLSASEARRANGAESAAPPNPEVVPVARRRRFSGAEKQRILEAADRCADSGEIGALLRREAIYSSQLSTWREQRRKAEREALTPQRRGPKPDLGLGEKRRDEAQTREIVRLRGELERARTIIDVQKKLCTLLGLPTAQENGEDT
jgi:transposase